MGGPARFAHHDPARLLAALLIVAAWSAPVVVPVVVPLASSTAGAQTTLPSSTVNVELAGSSFGHGDPGFNVGQVGNPDYFRRWRRGERFRYSFTQLPAGSGPYWVRLSISEVCPKTTTMDIRWGSFDNAVTQPIGPDTTAYTICTKGQNQGGFARVDTLGPYRLDPVSNQLHIEFEATAGLAVVSTIELGTSPTSYFLVVPADQSRHRQNLVARAQTGAFETVLGRLGSRYHLDLAAQRLAFRSSPLGTWADDLSDLVVAVRPVGSSTPRVLPLTDRYPVFSRVDQTLSLTSVRYEATDAATGVSLRATFLAPFYPQDEGTSLPPVFLLDLDVSAASPVEVVVARPVPYDVTDTVCVGCAPQPLLGHPGVRWGSLASFEDMNRALAPDEGQRVDEALAMLATSGGTVSVQSAPALDCSGFLPCFVPDSRDPNPFVFRPRSRGWVGIRWQLGGSTGTARLALAGTTEGEDALGTVLRLQRPAAAGEYAFRYRTALDLESVEDVVALAAARAGDWVARSQAFDETLGPSSFDLGDTASTSAARNLLAYGFQSWLVNTWWGDRVTGTGPEQWFSIWEGTCCFYHSTVDVVYNDAQVLLALWPELLGKQLDEWPLFTETDVATFEPYPMHDMGSFTSLEGQAYPFDMPVEESANYVLMLYAYWRTTGDTARVANHWATARGFARFIVKADQNQNGLPDRGTFNTIDQGSAAVLSSRDQIYLGVKGSAAAQAMLEMAGAAPGSTDLPDAERTALALHRHRVDQTINEQAWLDDHYAVTLDPAVSPAERKAESIYTANGLLYLLQGGGNLPVGGQTLERMRTDLHAATDATMGPSGSVHTSVGNANAWFSQNFWRDDVALYLGADWSGGGFIPLVQRYWDQQVDFARRLDGGWWDVVVYGGSVFTPDIVSTASVGSGADYKAAATTGFGQSLGYYPRGATAFGLLPAVLGISLNRPDGVLGTVGPARPGVRAPVYALGSWGPGPVVAPPVGSWSSGGTFAIGSGSALAPVPRPITEPSVSMPSTFSPNGDGAGDVLEGTVSVSPSSRLSASFAMGPAVRAEILAGSTVRWDGVLPLVGLIEQGQPARACVLADDFDPRTVRVGACSTVYSNITVPEPARTWYLAEGSTLYGFEEFVLVQNPGSVDATVEVTYQTPFGPVGREPVFVPAGARRTIRVNDDIAADVSTRLDSNVPIVAERAMYLRGPDGERREGHAVLGVTAPARSWYLAEGSTDHGFDQYVLVQNPSDEAASVTFTFSESGGDVGSRSMVVPPSSRATLYVNEVLTGDISTRVDSDVPVIVERAMYWGGPDRREGAHADTGITTPARTWYLAEGTTGFGFDEYLLLQNPGSTEATVELTYDLTGGPLPRGPLTLPPRSRTTIKVDDEIIEEDVSIRVASDVPVIAERAMYFGVPPGGGATSATGGHVAHGTPTPASTWHVAEGTTAHGFDQYVLIQNPGEKPAVVELLSQPDVAPPELVVVEVPPGTRRTIYANEFWPDQDLAILVSSSAPIVVERAMYFGGPDRRRGGTGTVVAR